MTTHSQFYKTRFNIKSIEFDANSIVKFKTRFNIKSIEFDTCSIVKFKPTNAKPVYKILILILKKMMERYPFTSNIYIDRFYDKYEKKYRNFKFLGAVPANFYVLNITVYHKKINVKICDIDFQSYINDGIDEFFIVINSDKSDSSGGHWTSLYFNFTKNQIYFNNIKTCESQKFNYKLIFNYAKVIKKLMKQYNPLVAIDSNIKK
jgi:hypothetical protein